MIKLTKQILNKVKSLGNYSLTFKLYKYAVKVVTGKRFKLMHKEIEAYNKNKNSAVWGGLGVYYKRIFGIGNFAIFYSNWIDSDIITENDINKFSDELIRKSKSITESQSWENMFNEKLFNQLMSHLTQGQKSFISEKLNSLDFPLSGMHGDFAEYHVLKTEKRFYLIDWEHYSSKGSVIMDLLLLHFHFQKKQNNLHSVNPRDIQLVLKAGLLKPISMALEIDELKLCLLLSIYVTTVRKGGRENINPTEINAFKSGIDNLLFNN